MTIENDFKELVSIWKYYFSALPITPNELDEYSKIISLIENDQIDLKENKNKLIKLIQDIFFECDEKSLGCCMRIKKYLETI